jgi:hypothetical protein
VEIQQHSHAIDQTNQVLPQLYELDILNLRKENLDEGNDEINSHE